MNGSNYLWKNGWRQGAIIDNNSSIEAIINNAQGYKSPNTQLPDLLVIISQSCDMLHQKIDEEPYIVLIAGYFNKERKGYLFYGKNPRRLQIEHHKRIIGFSAHDIFVILKESFEEVNPKQGSIALAKAEVKQIINWISRRYARAAFPDEFNSRLARANKIDKAKKNQLMESVSLIYIDITDEELKNDQNYETTMIIGVKHGSNQEIRDQVDSLFYKTFNVPGIDTEVIVLDENDITYETISTHKRFFDWDYRSLPEETDVASPTFGIDAV